jgi:S1-C subfamily serine protease
VSSTWGLVEGIVTVIKDYVPVEEMTGMIRTSVISEQGDSGAPVVNDHGELIGFVYATSPDFFARNADRAGP